MGRFAAQALFPLWGLQAPQPLREAHGRWFTGNGGVHFYRTSKLHTGPPRTPDEEFQAYMER